MRKILLLCGVAVPMLYAVADVAAGLHFEGYSFRDQTISELGAIGAPSRGLMVAILVPTYLCLTAFGVGVWQSAEGRRRLRVAGGVVVGLGILALAVGMFVPMQPRGTEQGLAGALHLMEGAVWMLGLLVAMGFAAAALGRRFAVYTAATVVVVLVFGGWAGMAGARIEAGLPTAWLGVIERVFWYAYELWFAAGPQASVRADRSRSPLASTSANRLMKRAAGAPSTISWLKERVRPDARTAGEDVVVLLLGVCAVNATQRNGIARC